jgi:hypothetical protein
MINRSLSQPEAWGQAIVIEDVGDVVYFYHFLFSISIFLRALAMAEVKTPT